MSLFDWLVVAHAVGDFLLQGGTMAARKNRDWSWMGIHIGLYMIPVSAVGIAYSLAARPPAWLTVTMLLFLAGSHALLDRRGFVQEWMRIVGIPLDHPWLPSVVDQAFHLVTLAIVAQVLVFASR